MEVRIVVGELLQMRREKMKAQYKESKARADESEARFKESEAENAELRQRLERNGPAEDAKQ